MKTKAIYLTTFFLLSVSPVVSGEMATPSTTDGFQLRYGDPSGKISLSIDQDISSGSHKSIANRSLLMNFDLGEAPGSFTVNIDDVKGSFTAHDMTQRLPVSGLKGQSFSLSKTDNDRVLKRTDSDSKLQIGLGEMVRSNYPVGLALAEIYPVLPEEPVTLGSTWKSFQDTRCLEGWEWTEGRLSSEHMVTAVDQENGHTILSITSKAHTQLSNVEGGADYDDELTRTSHWRFDATDGRLLSVSMEQETTGINTLPQGSAEISQLTKIDYSTSQ